MPPNSSRKMAFIELPGSYRCPSPVIQLANQSLAVKFSLTGGIADKLEAVAISTYAGMKPGTIQWVTPAKTNLDKIREQAQQYGGWLSLLRSHVKKKSKPCWAPRWSLLPKKLKA